VEGYIYLTAENGINLSLPFMGFYGDWTDAPVFDTAYWYQNNFWQVSTALPEGSEYFHVLWSDLQGTDWVLGFNPYTGPVQYENGNVVYNPANNVISNNGDGLMDYFEEIYLSLMRNAREVTFTYTDENGNEVYSETSEFVTKTMYYTSIGQVYPYLHSAYWYPYEFVDEAGEYRVYLTTDDQTFDGLGRVSATHRYTAAKTADGRLGFFCYLPSRSAIVFEKEKKTLN
jgi:hypothetical protein